MACVSPLHPCWPFGPFLAQYLPVFLPCHLHLVPLCCLDSSHYSGCCYCLLLLDLFHLVAQKLILCSSSLAFPTFFLVSLYLHSFCWKRIDALREGHCPISRYLATSILWRHHSVMEGSFITHLCSSHNLVSACRAVKPSQALQSQITEEVFFLKLGPHPTSLFFDIWNHRDCKCTLIPAVGVKGTSDKTSEIIFLENTNPTDLNGATWQTPDTCRRLIRLWRKDLQFCCLTS